MYMCLCRHDQDALTCLQQKNELVKLACRQTTSIKQIFKHDKAQDNKLHHNMTHHDTTLSDITRDAMT